MAKIGDKTIKFMTDLIFKSLMDAKEELNLLLLKAEGDLKIKIDCVLSVGENNGIVVEEKLRSSIPEKVERSLSGTVYENQLPLEFDVEGEE